MNKTFAHIIVGSGPSAVMAAQTLVEAGKEVAMLDVGNTDQDYTGLSEDTEFECLRKTDKQQHRYLLGDDLESIPWDEIKVGAQLSPARKAMIKDVSKWLPLESKNFVPMESLGKGGLGAGWGLGSYVYSAEELQKCGLKQDDMLPSYQTVTDRIGISVGDDDVRPYVLGGINNVQAPLKPDHSFKKIFARYAKKREDLNAKGIYFGSPSMAILTEDKGERKACDYKDMEFYNDYDKSAYRAQFTLDEIMYHSNFHYLPGHLVTDFTETENGVEVHCIHTRSQNKISFNAQKLILTAGALGNARIVLRSFPTLEKLPLLCNPYTYMPALHLGMLGKELGPKHSMTQAMMIYDPDSTHSDLVSVAMYSYSASLLLFKIMKEGPVNFGDGREIFQYLQSAFVIAGIHHPDHANGKKWMQLINDETSATGDKLHIDFKLEEAEEKHILHREKTIRAAMRKLGVYPITRLAPDYGGSIHYAGTLPFSEEEQLGTTTYDGKLHGTKNVYVADSSSFNYLPAKGITLSLMANADRVTRKILSNE